MEKCDISLVVCVGLFKIIRVTLVTGHLQTADQRKLRKTRISKAQRHVSH